MLFSDIIQWCENSSNNCIQIFRVFLKFLKMQSILRYSKYRKIYSFNNNISCYSKLELHKGCLANCIRSISRWSCKGDWYPGEVEDARPPTGGWSCPCVQSLSTSMVWWGGGRLRGWEPACRVLMRIRRWAGSDREVQKDYEHVGRIISCAGGPWRLQNVVQKGHAHVLQASCSLNDCGGGVSEERFHSSAASAFLHAQEDFQE